jgi:hypothetical protein
MGFVCGWPGGVIRKVTFSGGSAALAGSIVSVSRSSSSSRISELVRRVAQPAQVPHQLRDDSASRNIGTRTV